MNPKSNESAQQLKSFALKQKNSSNNSAIFFKAKVLFTTALVIEQEENVEILISFVNSDKLGKLELLEYDLDPNFYPTIFYPDYDFFNEEPNFLRIVGKHYKNTNIGDYVIDIFPI